MLFNKRIIAAVTILVGLIAACGESADHRIRSYANIEDTPENRQTEAQAYQQVQPADEIIHDMAEQMTQFFPGDEQAKAVDRLIEMIDMEAFQEASITAMVNTFTAGEIRAMTDFYSSPEGKTVMKKMPQYMGEMMPVIQKSIMQNMPTRDK